MEHHRENGYRWIDTEICTVLDQATGQFVVIRDNRYQGTLDEAIARAQHDPERFVVLTMSAVVPVKLR